MITFYLACCFVQYLQKVCPRDQNGDGGRGGVGEGAAAVGFRSIKLVHVCCLRVHKFVCVYFATMAMVLLLTSTIHIINLSNIFLYNCQSLLLHHERTTFIPLYSPFLIKSLSKDYFITVRFIENNLTTKLIEF